MGAFGGLILTNKGRILQAKAQAGAVLIYTRIGIGDGQLGSTAISDLTALKNQIMSLEITKLKIQSNSRAIVGGVLDNNTLTNGFYFRELGIFATDPDAGEILYCYANAGVLAEYIPAGGGADIVEKAIDIQVLTGNATNVSAIIDSSLVYVSESDFRDHKEDNTHIRIGDQVPQSQGVGGLWFQTGLGESNETGGGGLVLQNAIVADDPPGDTSKIWLDI